MRLQTSAGGGSRTADLPLAEAAGASSSPAPLPYDPTPSAHSQPDRGSADRAERHRQARIGHFDRQNPTATARYYHRRLADIYRVLVPPNQRVLELGCGRGDLLAALKPAVGVGIDFSPLTVEIASRQHPELRIVLADVQELCVQGEFDYIILSDLVNDLWDVQRVLEQVAAASSPSTRVIINSYSRLWELPLAAASGLGLASPSIGQNWLTAEDLENLLYLTGFEVIRVWQEVLCPVRLPAIDALCNKYLVRISPLRLLALANFMIARPAARRQEQAREEGPLVSVIVPARNEEGNIEAVFERVPEMGRGTEIVFVEGHSRDDTWGAIKRGIAQHPERRCKMLRQTGEGKGDAVRLGFASAEGDLLMILDADLTVAPEDLPRFYAALRSGAGEFANGVRLVYPMEGQAMRAFNLIGNKFFSWAFSWLLGQRIKDTLCGTKALSRHHYEVIAQNRAYFGDFDPFGDFDLIFGAARLNLKLADIPIRYQERTYGTTNIRRWKHGWALIRMALFASRRLKFT
jgi:SAM-dependent methyltransferase